MSAPLAIILEGTVDADCPQVEADEITANSHEISAALANLGYRVDILPFTLDLDAQRHRLLTLAPDVAFNLVDSIEGKGTIISIAPMLMAHLGIPCTGATARATMTSCDKLLAKQILHAHNIPTACWLTETQILAGGKELETSFILKSVNEHASFGLFSDSVVSDRTTLKKRLQEKKERYGGEWFAEQFIEGREFNQGVLASDKGAIALPAAEIVFTHEFPKDEPHIISYAAKWHKETAEYKGTVRNFDSANTDKKLATALKDIALSCWEAFGLTGYARIDFRIDNDGHPFVVDVNSNPLLTAHEGFAMAALQAGIDFQDIVRAIVADAYRSAARLAPKMLAA